MVYDSARRRIMLFAGGGNGSLFGDTWLLEVSALSSSSVYGMGCGSPVLTFTPDANARPVMGQVASATIFDSPTSIAAVALGFSDSLWGQVALPTSLAGVGLPGCELLQSSEALGLGVSPLTPSTMSFSLGVPDDLILLGTHAYIQAYAFAPGHNPAQIVVSNGIDWFFGSL